MQIVWLKTALKNLESELGYIAQDNPQAAALVSNRIFESVSHFLPSKTKSNRNSTRFPYLS